MIASAAAVSRSYGSATEPVAWQNETLSGCGVATGGPVVVWGGAVATLSGCDAATGGSVVVWGGAVATLSDGCVAPGALVGGGVPVAAAHGADPTSDTATTATNAVPRVAARRIAGL
jgi:hypothetical protein